MKAGTLSVWSTATSQVRRTGIGPRQVPEIRESMKTWERYSKEERNAFLHQEGNLATFCCKEPLVEEGQPAPPRPHLSLHPELRNHRAGSGGGPSWHSAPQELWSVHAGHGTTGPSHVICCAVSESQSAVLISDHLFGVRGGGKPLMCGTSQVFGK